MMVILWAETAGTAEKRTGVAISDKSGRPKQALAPGWATRQNPFNSSAYRIGVVTKVIATGKGSIAYEVRWMAEESGNIDGPALRRTTTTISLFSIQVKWRGAPGSMPARGLEPPRPKGTGPQPAVYTSSTTRATVAIIGQCRQLSNQLDRRARHFISQSG
jgi:hypothetical protein